VPSGDKKNPKYSFVAFIVFSSTTRPIHIETAYEMGAHLFFIKPDNYGELVRSLRCILNLDWSNPEKVKEQYCMNGTYKPIIKSGTE
jgi:DNA-binding NarL/FixJ family response regulator